MGVSRGHSAAFAGRLTMRAMPLGLKGLGGRAGRWAAAYDFVAFLAEPMIEGEAAYRADGGGGGVMVMLSRPLTGCWAGGSWP